MGRGNLAHLRFFALWERLAPTAPPDDPGRVSSLGLAPEASHTLNIGGQTLNDREAPEITEFYETLATGLGILETRGRVARQLSGAEFPRPAAGRSCSWPWKLSIDAGELAEATELANDVGQAKRTAAAQRALLKFLQVVPAGVWISFNSSHSRSAFGRRNCCPRGAGLTACTKWSDYERPFITESVQGPFHWLGACDIALDAAGQAIAFRVSADGLATLLASRRRNIYTRADRGAANFSGRCLATAGFSVTHSAQHVAN